MFHKLFRNEPGSELLQRAIDNVVGMLRHERRMLRSATDYLFEGREPEIDIRLLDKDMNVEERIIRRLVFEHLTINPNKEITGSLVLVSIVHDVERIGDYAKGILGLVETYGSLPPGARATERTAELRDSLFEVYELAQAGFENDDTDRARECIHLHRSNEKASKEIVNLIAEDDDLDKNQGILLSSAVRMIRRASAHLANIASSVVNPFDKIGGRADESI